MLCHFFLATSGLSWENHCHHILPGFFQYFSSLVFKSLIMMCLGVKLLFYHSWDSSWVSVSLSFTNVGIFSIISLNTLSIPLSSLSETPKLWMLDFLFLNVGSFAAVTQITKTLHFIQSIFTLLFRLGKFDWPVWKWIDSALCNFVSAMAPTQCDFYFNYCFISKIYILFYYVTSIF